MQKKWKEYVQATNWGLPFINQQLKLRKTRLRGLTSQKERNEIPTKKQGSKDPGAEKNKSAKLKQ